MTTDFQARSGIIGRAYEAQAELWLIRHGFHILGHKVRHASGVEFDIHARGFHGDEIGVECKASDDQAPEGSRGMRRSDNRWKVLGYLYALRVWQMQGNTAPRYILITSDMPDPGSEQRRILDLAELVGDIAIIHLPYESLPPT